MKSRTCFSIGCKIETIACPFIINDLTFTFCLLIIFVAMCSVYLCFYIRQGTESWERNWLLPRDHNQNKVNPDLYYYVIAATLYFKIKCFRDIILVSFFQQFDVNVGFSYSIVILLFWWLINTFLLTRLN